MTKYLKKEQLRRFVQAQGEAEVAFERYSQRTPNAPGLPTIPRIVREGSGGGGGGALLFVGGAVVLGGLAAIAIMILDALGG